MRQRNRTYIRVNPDSPTEIVGESLTDIELEYPWIDVTDISTLSGRGYKQRWYDQENHTIRLKTEIHLSIGTSLFDADGIDACCICVRGDNLDSDDEVRITINGDYYYVNIDSDIRLISETPGRYFVELDDPKYFSNPNSFTIIAQEPEGEEETDNG